MTLRIGIIGTGIMGADHAATLHRWVAGAEVTRVVDRDRVRAQTVADGLPGALLVADPVALVDDPEVDAVVIASPDATHPDLVRACVRAGKPVLCEKPLAPSLTEAAGLVTEIGAGASLVSLGFMRRFDPGYTELRATVAGGGIGHPVLLHSVGRGVSSGPGSTTESALTNSAVHDFDVVAWLLGSPVVEVSWHAGRSSGQVPDFSDPQLVLLRTADGVLSTVETFLNARYGYDIRCEVVGETGTAGLVEPVRVVTDGGLRRSTGYAADWRPRFAEAYRLELQAWVDEVTGRTAAGSSELATASDGLEAARVADAVIRSMHAGGAVLPVERAAT